MIKNKIPSILAIFALTIGLAAGVFLIQGQQNFRLSASAEHNPKDMRISNITSNSFVVSWYTDKNSSSYIDWGETKKLNNRAFPEESVLNRIHYVKIDNLKANTNHYFKINSGGDEYDNSGVPWTTKTSEKSSKETQVLTGKVMLTEYKPASGVIVYLKADTNNLYSSKTTGNGSWAIQIEKELPAETMFEIFVQGGALGTASVTTTKADINNLEFLYLRKTSNSTEKNITAPFELPSAEIILPKNAESRFFEVSD